MDRSFSVTWDYLCPFARNAHEHLVEALVDGAPWDVTFSPFSLVQAHVAEGDPPVWDWPEPAKGVLALQAGIVVRDRYPERFLEVHRALFAARHDEGKGLSDPDVVSAVLSAHGVPADDVFDQVADGWPLKELRTSHEASVADHTVFGVPTFVVADQSVFVRLMTRPDGDSGASRAILQRVLDLITDHPEINELKHTTIPR
ncbi:MAG TPA: DsbA family protein [Acidimicrobiales bacterium]|nr:DsbA family protein [Acidimicrobiales bacterium]